MVHRVLSWGLFIFITTCCIHAQEVEEIILIEEVEFYPTEYERIKIKQIRASAATDNFREIDKIWEEILSKEGDTQTLAQAILLQVAKDEQKQVEEAMQTLQKMNEMHQRQRDYIEELRKRKSALVDSLRNAYQEIHGALDGVEAMLDDSPGMLSLQEQIQQAEFEVSQTEKQAESMNIRLQLLMDQRNKAVQNLSDILEIDDDTRDKIIRNIK